MADSGGGGAFSGPRDASVMEAILKEMGVEEYEPNVINQMLEFSYSENNEQTAVCDRFLGYTSLSWRCDSCTTQYLSFIGYVTNVLDDARVYAEHAQKKELDISDVKLAVQTRMDHSFTTPPPRDVSTLLVFVF